MNQYPDYKPSGIDWIGDIPEHWEMKKLKYFAEVVLGKMLTPDAKAGYELKPYLRSANVQWMQADLSSVKEMWFSSDELEKLRLHENDLIVNEGGEVGRTCIWKNEIEECYIQNSVHKVSMLNSHNASYALYSFFFLGQKGHFDAVVNRISIAHLTGEKLKEISFVVPPLHEQTAIATYLDEKTAQLDGLIARKRRLMALLREEKAALINEAVTKGIRPNVPMKASDIEWLGNVPAHWEVKKLKHVATVRSGFALNASAVAENTIKIPYLRVANVQDGYLKLNDVTEVDIDSDVAQRYLLRVGDLLMNEGGDNDKLGRGCVWNGELDPCLHQNHVFAVRMNENINVEWINILTTTSYARQYFMLNCKQSTNLASISQTNIRELPVLMPPVLEQIDILAYLNAETIKIDFTVSRIEREIELMQEYRTALISEVVTGKIDVTPARTANA